MIRYALILCLGLAAACAAPPPPPAETIAMAEARVAPLPFGQACDGTAQSFVSAVKLLNAGYNPAVPPASYHPPAGSAFNWPTAISDDLRQAFDHAPASFKQYLCGLNGIYINASACPGNDPTRCGGGSPFSGAWGFRSRARTDLGHRYIAISATLWRNGGSAARFHDYETLLLRSFLPAGSGVAASPSANPDDPWMSVLAALAHEVGHVAWAEKTIPTVGNSYDFGGLISCPAGDFFIGWNYNKHDRIHRDLQPKGRWRPFNNRANEANSFLDHSAAPLLNAFGGSGTANAALGQLYQAGQPWASLFGAQTPDEDFVESYVMAVLTGDNPRAGIFAGPLMSLPISIPGASGAAPDVARDLVSGNKDALARKIRCIPL